MMIRLQGVLQRVWYWLIVFDVTHEIEKKYAEDLIVDIKHDVIDDPGLTKVGEQGDYHRQIPRRKTIFR